MARWTNTYKDTIHLTTISEQMPIAGIVRLELLNGIILEGVIRRLHLGNNAGEGGWKYYGECELEDVNKQRYVVDYLDIMNAKNIWTDEKAKEYEALGLITILK